MARKVHWEHYKKRTVTGVLAAAQKEHRLQQYSDLLFSQPWHP